VAVSHDSQQALPVPACSPADLVPTANSPRWAIYADYPQHPPTCRFFPKVFAIAGPTAILWGAVPACARDRAVQIARLWRC